MSKNDELAFPVSTIDGFTNSGMMLRDYFAGQAMTLNFGAKLSAQEVAYHAYVIADAMLTARATTTERT